MDRDRRRLAVLDHVAPVRGEVPDLTAWDVILASSSAGKDSQAMLDYVVEEARTAGVLDRVVVVHADLGRMEWAGTRELAERQAAHYGLRFEVVSRIGGTSPGGRTDGAAYAKGETFGDLLDHIERRGKWPDAANRFCTSDHKRGPIRGLITRLHREHGTQRPFRLLNCMGMRAEESSKRRGFAQLVRGAAPHAAGTTESCTKLREVWTWLPLQHWTEAQVWARIERSGVPHHPAYDAGMPRLSCCFCIFAPRAALMIAGQHNRALLDDYVRVEAKIGHTFRHRFALSQIAEALDAGELFDVADVEELARAWNM